MSEAFQSAAWQAMTYAMQIDDVVSPVADSFRPFSSVAGCFRSFLSFSSLPF